MLRNHLHRTSWVRITIFQSNRRKAAVCAFAAKKRPGNSLFPQSTHGGMCRHCSRGDHTVSKPTTTCRDRKLFLPHGRRSNHGHLFLSNPALSKRRVDKPVTRILFASNICPFFLFVQHRKCCSLLRSRWIKLAVSLFYSCHPCGRKKILL